MSGSFKLLQRATDVVLLVMLASLPLGALGFIARSL
jgi:hypothetical protein